MILKFLPFLLIFALGILLKRFGILKIKDGEQLLKLVFYATLPALILNTLTATPIDTRLLFLPVISAIVIFTTFILALAGMRFFKLTEAGKGVFVVGSMILNIGFVLPFVSVALGNEGLVPLFIFDLSNIILAFSFVYYQACRYGNTSAAVVPTLKKLAMSPPLWALFAGLGLNLLKIPLNGAFVEFLKMTGGMTAPILMIVVGIYFNPVMKNLRPVAAVITIRMAAGLLAGILLAAIFQLDGILRTIVIAGSGTPVGYNTLTFASLENLDSEFAANLVSISLFIGIFYVPFLIWAFGP